MLDPVTDPGVRVFSGGTWQSKVMGDNFVDNAWGIAGDDICDGVEVKRQQPASGRRPPAERRALPT